MTNNNNNNNNDDDDKDLDFEDDDDENIPRYFRTTKIAVFEVGKTSNDQQQQ